MDMTMTEEQPKSNALPMAIVAVLFFILGFATWLNGSLMPYLKQILQLTLFQASLILFSFGCRSFKSTKDLFIFSMLSVS
jgi:FHS family L-fucose permease-like MFS transporter